MKKSVLCEACYDCKYCGNFGQKSIKAAACLYAYYKGKPRGCSIEGCTRYVKKDITTEQTQMQED